MKKNFKNLLLIVVFVATCISCKKDDSTSTQPTTQTVTDIDGNVYHTIVIGTQTWMVENLKVTHYKNGTSIPNVTENLAWSELTTGAYCDYENIPSNSSTYGRLYNWHAVNSGNLCPTGWHVPTDAELTTLINFLGGANLAGGKLKETGLIHWDSPNTSATNESGFNALPAGYRLNNGTFFGMKANCAWWSSTENASNSAWTRSLSYNGSYVSRFFDDKTIGYSIRCIKD